MKLLDNVALTEDLPRNRLRRGQVGTIVELLAPQVYEVEFSDLPLGDDCSICENGSVPFRPLPCLPLRKFPVPW